MLLKRFDFASHGLCLRAFFTQRVMSTLAKSKNKASSRTKVSCLWCEGIVPFWQEFVEDHGVQNDILDYFCGAATDFAVRWLRTGGTRIQAFSTEHILEKLRWWRLGDVCQAIDAIEESLTLTQQRSERRLLESRLADLKRLSKLQVNFNNF